MNYAELEARARAMMPKPACARCGTPFAPEGDGALADSFMQACACLPNEVLPIAVLPIARKETP